MNAGPLNQRVTIERFTTTTDPDYGTVIETWTTLAEVWAAVEPLNGREYFTATMALSEVTTRIRLRYRPGLTVLDRIAHAGVRHNIQAIINPRSANRELVLMCKAAAV